MKRFLRRLLTKAWTLPCDICKEPTPCRVPFYWRKLEGETVRCGPCVSHRVFVISGGMFGACDPRKGIEHFPEDAK